MSIMRSAPNGITGITNVWSNFSHFLKKKSTALVGEKRTPPKLKLRIYLVGFLANLHEPT